MIMVRTGVRRRGMSLLLDSLYEELVVANSLARGAAYSMSDCTSMELHTPHRGQL